MTMLQSLLLWKSPWIWSLHFCSTSEFKPGNQNSSSMPTATLQGLSDILIYNQILSCVPTSHLAVSLLQQLRNEKLRPTEITFGACLNACVKNGQWTMALAIQDILCDQIGWQISCILKRTTVRVFFPFRFEFSHTKSFTFHWYPRGNIPKGYLVKGLRWMRQRYLRDRTHTYRFQMCVSICLEFRICHYILIYLKFLTYHIESSKYCLLKKVRPKTKSPQVLVASYFLGQKATYLNKNHQQNSCQEQANSDACANLITGSLTVKSFADALQWKDPRFRTSGGWFIRVKNLRVYGVEIWFLIGFIILYCFSKMIQEKTANQRV